MFSIERYVRFSREQLVRRQPLPSSRPAIPAPCGEAEVSGVKKHRSEAGPGLEVIEATSHLPRNRRVVARVLGQVRTRIRTRNLSPRTEKTYLAWIERYIGFHGRRDPTGMGRAEIEAFLGHLGAELGLGAASLNQAAAAVLFLYRELYREEYGGRDGVVRAKPVQSLPRYATPPGSTSVCTAECHLLVWRKRVRPQTPWANSSRHGVGSRVRWAALSERRIRLVRVSRACIARGPRGHWGWYEQKVGSPGILSSAP